MASSWIDRLEYKMTGKSSKELKAEQDATQARKQAESSAAIQAQWDKDAADKAAIAAASKKVQDDIDRAAKLVAENTTDAKKEAANVIKLAKKDAEQLSNKYGIDISKLIEGATAATEKALALSSRDSEATIAKSKIATDAAVAEMNDKFKTAITTLETSTGTLREAQAAAFGSAESQQKARADYEMKEVEKYKAQTAKEKAGILQEAPITELQKAAMGTTQSAAEIMIKNQAREAQQRASSAAYARGFSPAAQRAAIMAGSQAQMTATGQAATMRAGEQATAREQFATAYANRQGQLQQAEQFGLNMGLSVEQMYQNAINIKLQAAETDKQLTSQMILNKLGMTTQAAQLGMGAQMQQASQAMSARQQNTQNILAGRQANIAQGTAMKQGALNTGLAAQLDLNTMGVQQQGALTSQGLGATSGIAAAAPSTVLGAQQQTWQNQQYIAAQALAAQQERDRLAAEAKAASEKFYNDLILKAAGSTIGAAGTVAVNTLSPSTNLAAPSQVTTPAVTSYVNQPSKSTYA